MRALFLVLIIAVLALIVAVMSGMVDIRQTRPAVAPGIESANGKLVARHGQAPTFAVETGSVAVGAGQASVAVPKVEIQPSDTRIAVPSVQVRRPGTTPPAAPATPPAPAAPATPAQ